MSFLKQVEAMGKRGPGMGYYLGEKGLPGIETFWINQNNTALMFSKDIWDMDKLPDLFEKLKITHEVRPNGVVVFLAPDAVQKSNVDTIIKNMKQIKKLNKKKMHFFLKKVKEYLP